MKGARSEMSTPFSCLWLKTSTPAGAASASSLTHSLCPWELTHPITNPPFQRHSCMVSSRTEMAAQLWLCLAAPQTLHRPCSHPPEAAQSSWQVSVQGETEPNWKFNFQTTCTNSQYIQSMSFLQKKPNLKHNRRLESSLEIFCISWRSKTLPRKRTEYLYRISIYLSL